LEVTVEPEEAEAGGERVGKTRISVDRALPFSRTGIVAPKSNKKKHFDPIVADHMNNYHFIIFHFPIQ